MTYGKFHEATILENIASPYILCFSYNKFEGGQTKVVSLPDFPLYKREPHNDRALVKELYRVLSNVDCVIAHNASFDIGIANARFMHYGFPPIKPFKRVCTLLLARRLARFPSNTLKELALFLGVTHKMETSKNIWQDIHFRKSPKAWREMCKYNKVDSIAGREIAKILISWDGKVDKPVSRRACEWCESDKTIYRGRTQGKRQGYRFTCTKCRRWGTVYT